MVNSARAGRGLCIGEQDNPRDPWCALFHGEPLFLFAEILAFRPDDAAFAFDHAIDEDPYTAQVEVWRLAKTLKGWMERIAQIAPMAFSKQLQQLRQEIDLDRLLANLVDAGPSGAVLAAQAARRGKRGRPQTNAIDAARAAKADLINTHHLLRNAVAALKPQARIGFETRRVSGQIDPALGLLLAELQTADRVAERINGLVPRHTHFYYGDIIGQELRTAGSETVLLHLDPVTRRSVLPAGTQIEARLPDNSIQRFETDASVPLTPLSIGDVATLSYLTEPDVSFNAAFGAITNAVATRRTGTKEDDRGGVFSFGKELPLSMGIKVSSPVLELREGRRKIEVRLNLQRASDLPAEPRPYADAEPRPAPGTVDPELLLALRSDAELLQSFFPGAFEATVDRLGRVVTKLAERRDERPALWHIYETLAQEDMPNAQALRLLLSRQVSMCLIENVPFPTGTYWRNMITHIRTWRAELSGSQIGHARRSPPRLPHHSSVFGAFSALPDGTVDAAPEDVFQKLLGDAFIVKISTASGMISPAIAHIEPNRRPGEAGLTVSIEINEGNPAIEGLSAGAAPSLSVQINPRAIACPISFFERYRLGSVDFTVSADGLKKLVAFSDAGRITTDQTFTPFGIQPDDGSTFVIGCPEMATKAVIEVGAKLHWAELPDAPGGLANLYKNYGQELVSPEPTLVFDYLSGDGWKPVLTDPKPMLETDPVTARLRADWAFSGTIQGHTEAAQGRIDAKEFATRQSIRAGVLRMTISNTEGGFHAQRYPMALVSAMRPTWNPLRNKQLPLPPYVPRCASIELSYTAKHRIDVEAPNAAAIGDQIVQIGPFGDFEVYPNRKLREIGLFPSRLGFGELYIQLLGTELSGPMTLVFEMAESGHLRATPRPVKLAWYYLSQQGWEALPETALVSDTTAGLMRSGTVVLDVPGGGRANSPEMPAGGIWVAAVSEDAALSNFPTLKRVSANAVWATSEGARYYDGAEPRIWTFNPPRPEITEITHIPARAGTRPPETTRDYLVRVSERLKHRARAVTPWDIERLVLEAFPEVWMAKCLPHSQRDKSTPTPGHLTLVVVPPRGDLAQERVARQRVFDVGTLERIDTFIRGRLTELASIDVVNPSYERLQVRAKLQFRRDLEETTTAQRLKSELAKYLSVWTADPALGRFGWSLDVQGLRAFIEAKDYVQLITDFSVLHLSSDDFSDHHLADTARGAEVRLRAARPWGLPLSAPDHVITLHSDLQEEDAMPSGVGRLGVGDMLVVGHGRLA
ncbi:MAG: hypothetical protein AAF330_01775 [Pseudomonadota bacterium]